MPDAYDQCGVLYERSGGIIDSYILSIAAAAIICAIAVKLTEGQGPQGAIIKLIAGLLLTFTVIRPLANLEFSKWSDITLEITDRAQTAVGEGEDMTKQALASGIISRTEAYILDKAEALGLSLEVEVTVSEDDIPVPIAVRLTGNASPFAKSRLASMIQQDLGISREDQTWS